MSEIPQRVMPGDIWHIGRHRLACLDATDPWGVARLFGKETWDVLLTSPPYAHQRTYGLPNFDWSRLMVGATEAALRHASERFHALFNLGLVHRHGRVDEYWRAWLIACRRLGLPLYGWYVWDKCFGFPGNHHGRLSPSHEFIFHLARNPWSPAKWLKKKHLAVRGGQGSRTCDGRLRPWSSPQACAQPTKIPDSVIRLPSERRRGIHTRHHPAVFPVDLPLFLLRTFGQAGCVVYEPFAGSGTTILAAEQLGMTVRAVEISPHYCDLILTRVEQETGIQPVKEV